MKRLALLSAFAFALAGTACGGSESGGSEAAGGGEQAAPMEHEMPAAGEQMAEAPMGELMTPEWFQMDGSNVTLDITAGATNAQNYWNFNGFLGGHGEIVVPAGSHVTINFKNDDPNMAHSLGIEAWRDSMMGAITPNPVFAGAVSTNPGSLTDATMPGQSEVITFTAETAGKYQMLCYIPGHAQIGMWVAFTVSSDGSAGVRQ
ncbi:MAG: sulfocyanin-like copper-binding protein [Gemmatimonadota bacterium]